MTSASLLTAAFLVCSLTAFTQDQRSTGIQVPDNATASPVTNQDSVGTLTAPWEISPNRPSDLSSDPKNPIRVDQFRYDPGSFDFRTGRPKLEPKAGIMSSGLDQRLDADTTCYTIRSYVVARDAKDSDSTHLAGYSTCQQASRYHLKTAVEAGFSAER